MFILLFSVSSNLKAFREGSVPPAPSRFVCSWKQAPWVTPTCRGSLCPGTFLQPCAAAVDANPTPSASHTFPQSHKERCMRIQLEWQLRGWLGRVGRYWGQVSCYSPKEWGCAWHWTCFQNRPPSRSSSFPEEPLTHASNRTAMVSGCKVVLWKCSI